MNFEFWRGKRVFLTGHTGFKGAWAAIWLKRLGAEVFGYALPPETQPSLFELTELAGCINHTLGDIRIYTKLAAALTEARPDIVIHMAAQPLVRYSYSNPLETFDTNIMGTANLLQACRNIPGIRSIVIVTTDKVYENPEQDIGFVENNSLGGHDPYSSSKACAEIITSAMRRSFYHNSQAKVGSARAGNVIGGGDWAMDRLIPDIVRSVNSGRVVEVRHPNAIRPWQHVLEPLSGYFSLAEKLYLAGDSFDHAWNFGPNDEDAKSVEYLVDKFCTLWGEPAKWMLDVDKHVHEAKFLRLNISKAKQQLNWSPRWNVDKALEETVRWYKEFENTSSVKNLCLTQIEEYSMEFKCL